MISRRASYSIVISTIAVISFWDLMFFNKRLTSSGVTALIDYVSAHVVTCLIPAFFISGAIVALVSKESVLRYFGAGTGKALAYSVASISGAILAVCSCTILPLFTGIRRKGAGLGPAVTFLFAGPAINVLAIFYSAQLLGWDVGLARAIFSVSMSIWIGLAMSYLFKRGEEASQTQIARRLARAKDPSSGEFTLKSLRNPVFLILLVLVLIIGTSQFLTFEVKLIGIPILIMLILAALKAWFTRLEVNIWLRETLNIAELIFPILLIGVYLAGWLTVLVPQEIVSRYLGGNSLLSNLVASIIGAVMYFATLTEVPIVKSLMLLGMGRGPALALLLAGPSLSLPSMIVLGRILGPKKTIAYIILVVMSAAASGILFGMVAG